MRSTNKRKAWCTTMAVATPVALAFGLVTTASGGPGTGASDDLSHAKFSDSRSSTAPLPITAANELANLAAINQGAPCQYDDGTSENALGWTDGGVIAWAQRYDSTCSEEIENIATTYGADGSADGGVNDGDPVGYAIMTDAGSGPGDVIWSGEDTIDGASINTNDFQVLDVSPPQTVSGSFYVVAWVEHTAGTFPAPMDEDSASGLADDVWLLGNIGDSFGNFDPAESEELENMAAVGFPTAWMLRANEGGEFPPGACCFDEAPCPEDLTGDGSVGGGDLGTLLAAWGECADPDNCPEDLTGDGNVGGGDLGTLLAAWGDCPAGDGGCDLYDDEAACVDAGGEWAGHGTNCADHCPIVGACCDGEDCLTLSPQECADIGGDYLGNFVECEADTCLEEGCGAPGTGDCCIANGTPYCEDEACCEAVCAGDPFCCETSWDSLCANDANDICEVCEPPAPDSNCCEGHGGEGCEDEWCEDIVCDIDLGCCFTWDSGCANLAADFCDDLCEPGSLPTEADYQYDTGVSTNALGLTDGGVIGWAQRYDADGTDTIENIATSYGYIESTDGGVVDGDPVGIAILEDGGDGPGAVIWSSEESIDGASINSDVMQVFDVPDVEVSGAFYLAAWVEHPAGSFPAPMDEASIDGTPGAFANDVYGLLATGSTFAEFDIANLDPDGVLQMSGAGFPTVWMIRGNQDD